VFPARPDDGTRVTHIPPLNVVVAVVAAGSKITVASGTGTVKFALVIVCPVKWIVTGVEPRPLGLSTLVNQMYLPALIGVPLKLAVLEVEI
jgi:hypothetical protein